ncbi:MAG: DUF2778 domain-containing protein [Hyphomicrobiaceae bacterium]|nr:DUF2778 domain-containing protein [Hyphomicrobiaceae bacterium]
MGFRGKTATSLRVLLAAPVAVLMLAVGSARAEQRPASAPGPGAAGDIANFFSQVGDQIYEDCIFELSEEQLEVQRALIAAYMKHGAPHALARQLAVKQIRPPRLSDRCKRIKNQKGIPPAEVAMPGPSAPPAEQEPGAVPPLPPPAAAPAPAPSWNVKTTPVAIAPKAPVERGEPYSAAIALADRKVLPHWDCAPGVDYVTIQHKGFERKLSDGEICAPFEDVVHQVPDTERTFRIGYTIRSGRLFVISSDPALNGRTIAWAISGRDVCRNNPDPDCLAARAVGPLPPGEYNFSSHAGSRVSWGPRTRRLVAGIYLTKLYNRDKYTPAQTAAILARGNIAIHVRLKGEMSEACLGLGERGWAYVAQLIKDGRATGVTAYIDEPHPQVAERAPPIKKASSFSLTSLFK